MLCTPRQLSPYFAQPEHSVQLVLADGTPAFHRIQPHAGTRPSSPAALLGTPRRGMVDFGYAPELQRRSRRDTVAVRAHAVAVPQIWVRTRSAGDPCPRRIQKAVATERTTHTLFLSSRIQTTRLLSKLSEQILGGGPKGLQR